jgi:MATE family multidrug resistance protein
LAKDVESIDAPVGVAAEAAEPELGLAPAEVEAAARVPDRPRVDLLSGNVRRAVIWLALPVLGEQLLNSLVAWNDTFLAGRISAVATSAVGFGAYISWLVSLLFSLVGIGATAIVARSIGAGRRRDANIAANQAVVLSLALGLVAMASMYAVAPGLVHLLGLSAEAAPVAVQYIRIDLWGYLAESLTFIGAAAMRGAGNTRTPMKLIGAVNILNAPISWIMTFGIGSWSGVGIPGIAWGTAIARNVGGLMALYILLAGVNDLRLARGLLRPRGDWIRRILRIGLPASLDSAIMWVGHFLFLRIITHAPHESAGDVMFAAHIIGIRIESLSYLPAFAFSVAASTMVGQNLGAGNPSRALECAREARRQAMMMLIGTGLLFFAGAPWLFRLLSNDPAVVACGVPALRGLAFIQPFIATLIVYLGALRGAGDTLVPMIFTVVGILGLRLPIGYLGGVVLQGGLIGVWSGMFVDLIVRSLLMTWRLRTGRWQRIRV